MEVIKFSVPKPKHRVHKMLFDCDSPFKPSKVERKDTYKRRLKNNKQWQQSLE